MGLRRYLDVGAVWVFPLGAQPLQEARSRYAVTGAPGTGVGPWGPYLTFDGAADYVTLTAAEEWMLRFDSGAQDFSVVAWVRRAVTGVWQYIIDKEDADADGWKLRFRNNDVLEFRINARLASGPAPVTDTLWHCVIGVVDRSVGLTAYIDGTPGTPTAAVAEVIATTAAPVIGGRCFDALYRWQGDIAGIFVIPRVLSAAECLGIATGKAFDYL